MGDQPLDPGEAPGSEDWHPLGVKAGLYAELAIMIWLCSGLLFNRTDRGGYVDVISLSDVSTWVWSGLGLQLVVLVIGVLAMVRRSTRAFGKPLSFTAVVGTVVTICMFVLAYFVMPFA